MLLPDMYQQYLPSCTIKNTAHYQHCIRITSSTIKEIENPRYLMAGILLDSTTSNCYRPLIITNWTNHTSIITTAYHQVWNHHVTLSVCERLLSSYCIVINICSDPTSEIVTQCIPLTVVTISLLMHMSFCYHSLFFSSSSTNRVGLSSSSSVTPYDSFRVVTVFNLQRRLQFEQGNLFLGNCISCWSVSSDTIEPSCTWIVEKLENWK